MEKFNPASFAKSSAKPHHIEVMWNQGGVEGGFVFPSVKKHRTLLGENVYLVGWPDREGCFSVQLSGDGLDIALYECNPKELTQVDIDNAIFKEMDIYPGWGFEALRILSAELENIKRA